MPRWLSVRAGASNYTEGYIHTMLPICRSSGITYGAISNPYIQFTARCESLPLAGHSIATGKLITGTEPVYPGAALYEILMEEREQMAMVNLYGNRQGRQYGKREG